jgi:hypothetical protein
VGGPVHVILFDLGGVLVEVTGPSTLLQEAERALGEHGILAC